MKSRLIVLAMVALGAGIACAPRYALTVPGPKGESASNDLIIQELLVRNLVAKEPTRHVILVSFGETRTDNVDPPAAFFDRLEDLDASLRPVSKYDAPTHPNALLLVVHVIEMTSETEATVAVTRFRYTAGASDGFTAAVAWSDGVWKIAKTSRHWST